jgi:hypothetical protein
MKSTILLDHDTPRPDGLLSLRVLWSCGICSWWRRTTRRCRASRSASPPPASRTPTWARWTSSRAKEAPLAIYSLASSSAEDAPRGMQFLYALDRMNVATSRARVATLVVASPRIFTTECKRPEQMRLVNAFVRYGEMAGRGWEPPDG